MITSSPEKTRKDKTPVIIAWMRTFSVPKKAEWPAKSLSWARPLVFALALGVAFRTYLGSGKLGNSVHHPTVALGKQRTFSVGATLPSLA